MPFPMEQLLESARELDREDELREFRDAFWIPQRPAGGDQVYLCGHSLGLQPRAAAAALESEMQRWRDLAVSGHFRGEPAWIELGDKLAQSFAGLFGAEPREIAVMNTLTVNLHLLMVSFFRPAGPYRARRLSFRPLRRSLPAALSRPRPVRLPDRIRAAARQPPA